MNENGTVNGLAHVQEGMFCGRGVRGWAASGNAALFAFVDRLATMAFPLAVRRPKNIVL